MFTSDTFQTCILVEYSASQSNRPDLLLRNGVGVEAFCLPFLVFDKVLLAFQPQINPGMFPFTDHKRFDLVIVHVFACT